MELFTEQYAEIKSTTKVFFDRNKAEQYAKEVRTYIFNVIAREETKNGRKEYFYGYGVPK